MSSRDPIDELHEKLEELRTLRKKEEEEYGKILTLLDQRWEFPLPSEFSKQLEEVKEALNRSWDISQEAFSVFHNEDRVFWKEVAGASAEYITPVVRQQKEFNSLVVHLINEFLAAVTQALGSIRDFQSMLILYFQRIIPVVDTKNREMIGIEDKNVALNLNKFRKEIFELHTQTQESARDHADVLFKILDRRMETQEVDAQERDKILQSLETSLRSLHHVATAWSSARKAGKALSGSEEARYFFFEERFRGSREWVKEKFAGYVRYFETGIDALVLDLGCGRGEFLELLKEASIRGKGVDSNQAMVEKSREAGLDVSHGDLLQFLLSQPVNSLGGIFCSQVVEHLSAGVLLRLLEAAFARLKTGAPILLETVNTGSVFALTQVFTRDLTHTTPIHPETLQFMVNACGFKRPEILYTSPVPVVQQLKLFAKPENEVQEIFNHNMSQLNQLLYGPMEFAVYAVK
ncbi:methyltransferase domain-containing protein [bacterium]|nr:methyltransferase domain-containing protein [bacterium]